MIRAGCAIVASLLITGCVTGLPHNPATVGKETEAGPELSVQLGALPEGASIGRELIAPSGSTDAQEAGQRLALLNSYGLVRQKALNAYLDELAGKILTVVGMPRSCCRVEVVSDLSLHAEAQPSGLIVVSFGWLMQAEDEAELVALLAHELGHVLLGHHDSDSYAAAPTLAHQVAAVAGALSPKLNQIATVGKSLSYGSMLSNDVFHPAWKRSQENEADRFATDVIAKLGYSVARGPKAMLERLAATESPVPVSEPREASPSRKVSAQLKGWVEGLSKSHDDAISRAELAVAYYEKVWSESPLRGSRASHTGLAELRKDPEFASLLAMHQLAAKARELSATGNAGAALNEVNYRKGEKPGLLIRHMALCDAWLAVSKVREARECFAEGMRLSAGSWIPARALSNHLKATGDGPQAIRIAETGFNSLGRPPILLPEIAFLVRDLNKEVANKYVQECVGGGPALLQACVNNANHEERIRRSQEEGERIAKRITKKLSGQ